MNIIAFDSATDVFSAGIMINNNEQAKTGKPECFYLEIDKGQKHSELIMDAADTLIRTAGIKKTDIGAVACMEGPGSFTGLRIGFAAAKGLSLALGIPIIPVPTLGCMAHSYSFWPGIVLPVIDAKKNAVFTALYRQGRRLSDYFDTGTENLLKIIKNTCCEQNLPSPLLLLTGPAPALIIDRLSEVYPDTVASNTGSRGYAFELLYIAQKTGILSEQHDILGPKYIRKSDAEL